MPWWTCCGTPGAWAGSRPPRIRSGSAWRLGKAGATLYLMDRYLTRIGLMRFDRFTTKFQQAFADAQSIAVGHDNPYIEPQHLLLALLEQEDGGAGAILQRAGVNVPPLREELNKSIQRLPKVEGTAGEVNVSRDLGNLLNLTDKEAQKRGDQFIA